MRVLILLAALVALISAHSFSQKICQDAQCSIGCITNTFPADTCLQVTGGGSAMCHCATNALIEQIFDSGDCSGTPQTFNAPLNQCVQDTSGSYLENICSNDKTGSVAQITTTGAAHRFL
jgi:hypothetical protein